MNASTTLTKREAMFLSERLAGMTAKQSADLHGVKWRSVLQTLRRAEKRLGRKLFARPRTEHLTAKQRVYLQLLEVDGVPAAEVARRLGVCEMAVTNAIRGLERKLGRPLRRVFANKAPLGRPDFVARDLKCRCGLRLPCRACLPGKAADYVRSGMPAGGEV